MPSSRTADSPPPKLGFNPEIGDLFVKLDTLFRLDPAFCFPTDATRLVWQLKTPDGVGLLYLNSNDIALPRACVLRSALEGYLCGQGLHLRVDLPPSLHTGQLSLTVVIGSRASLEICAVHADVTMALLTVTLELLSASINPGDND